MKKILNLSLLAFCLLLALAGCNNETPQQTQMPEVPKVADNTGVPVYLDGQLVAVALARDGSTYLPSRTMFETVGADVVWNAAEQKITATFANGNVLTIPLNGEFAEMNRPDGSASGYPLSPQLFVENETTYLPLRLVTDDILDYDVDWHDNAVWLATPKLPYTTNAGDEFSLNLLDGSLSREDETLGRLALPSIDNPSSWYRPFDMRVSPTAAGNYLVTVEGMGSGALSFSYLVMAFVPADGGEITTCCAHTIMVVDLPRPVVQGDNIWLSDDEAGAVCINEKTGEVTYKLDKSYLDEYATGFVWWADGDWLLLGDGASFNLYNLQDKTWLNMEETLVTSAVKAEAEAFLQANSDINITEENFNMYWQYLGNGMPMSDSTPIFAFAGSDGKELRFMLTCKCYNRQQEECVKEFALNYQLPE